MPRQREPYSWTVVSLPEHDLGEAVFDLAKPLLERLGSESRIEDQRAVLDLATEFWNASVLASKQWTVPRAKELTELRRRMRGRHAAPDAVETFDLLAERWRDHAFDPRLVESWTYAVSDSGARSFACTMTLPEGVKAEDPPAREKRIRIGGKFLDEVLIAQSTTSYLRFPVERHRAVVAEDATATVHAVSLAVLQLFAEGRLQRVGGEPVAVEIGTRDLGNMVLAEVRCAGEIAVLVFKPRESEEV